MAKFVAIGILLFYLPLLILVIMAVVIKKSVIPEFEVPCELFFTEDIPCLAPGSHDDCYLATKWSAMGQ